MEWISVKDKLPSPDPDIWGGDVRSSFVLCCNRSGAILLSLCYYSHDYDEWHDAFNATEETRVAYWQPLPKPPIN